MVRKRYLSGIKIRRLYRPREAGRPEWGGMGDILDVSGRKREKPCGGARATVSSLQHVDLILLQEQR